MTELPFSQACENNKQPILDILLHEFAASQHVLEVGSGTGQHAVFFAENLPHLTWHCADLPINHEHINIRIKQAALANLKPPIALDLNQAWPIDESLKIDAIFTANTFHIVSWPLVQQFFLGVEKHLQANGKLCIYGPFNYNGQFTSASNANFELWLKERSPTSGIRDFEAIVELAEQAGLTLTADNEMPANNRLLVFSKHAKV